MIFFLQSKEKNRWKKFLHEAIKKNFSVITDKKNHKIPLNSQVKVNNSLNFLTKCATDYRENINTNIIGITGSCGKTTLKELLGNSMKKISTIFYSPKSFNNKFGVPLSILNLDQNKKFGIFEVGMDKKEK